MNNDKGFNEHLEGMLEATISDKQDAVVMSTLNDVMEHYEPATEEQTLEEKLMGEEQKLNEKGIVEIQPQVQSKFNTSMIVCTQCTESVYYLGKTPSGWEDEQCPECKQLKVS